MATPQTDPAAALARRRENGGQVTNTLADQIRKMEPQFAMAMPKGAEASQLIRDAITALRTTKGLADCEPTSVLGALMTCAQLGLRPAVAGLGHAYLLPFRDRGTPKAQLVIGYQGLIELAHRSGKIKSLIARTVYEHDHFDVDYGLADTLVHKPLLFGERGNPIAYYAIVKFDTGGYAFWVMSQRDVEQHRDKHSKAKAFGPWVDHFEAMAHKGLALDTPIPTATGWSTMGELQVGGQLFDMYGQPTIVRALSEIKHLDCYRVTFANGASVVCDSEHIWVAGIGRNAARDRGRTGWESYEITDLYAAKRDGKAVVMPVVGPLATEPVDLLIDPWMLGYWLGDGASANASVSCHANQLDDVQTGVAASGYTVGSVRPDSRSQAVSVGVRGGLAKDLARLGVLGHKHVPAQYLRGSAGQRLALLRGLIDSDGHIDARRGRVRFVNTDKGLTDAVAELARSLGEVVHLVERDGVGFGKTVRVFEAAWLPTVCPATFKDKVERVRGRRVASYRSVKSIELIESVPTRCIAVDSETRTYAAGNEMVPTHNTCVRMLAKYMPKATDLAVALAADEGVRIDLTPNLDAAESTQHPVYDGEVVDQSAMDDSGAQPEPWDDVTVAQPPHTEETN